MGEVNLGGFSAAPTDPSRKYLRSDSTESEWMPIWISTEAPPTSTLSLQLTATQVPEPSAALLLVVGAGLVWRRRRRA